MRGILQQRLPVPSSENRDTQDATIPSVWHPDSVVGLLGAVDRSSAKANEITPFSYWPAGWDYVRGYSDAETGGPSLG